MSAAAARRAVDAFFVAFNARDIEGIRASLNFPHVRIASGRVVVTGDASQFHIPFDELVAREGWHRSTLDSADTVQEGTGKVHFDVRFSRYGKDGVCYASYMSLWIVTSQGDHWGVQARSSFAP